jgi:hypothetical protein
MAADRYALAMVIVCEAATTLALLTVASPWIGVLTTGALSLVLVVWAFRRRQDARGTTANATTHSVTAG